MTKHIIEDVMTPDVVNFFIQMIFTPPPIMTMTYFLPPPPPWKRRLLDVIHVQSLTEKTTHFYESP